MPQQFGGYGFPASYGGFGPGGFGGHINFPVSNHYHYHSGGYSPPLSGGYGLGNPYVDCSLNVFIVA
ncbi:unnamed protein product [Didymodactylos carnosus]|uniref:Uncharacterized protein n=1 Tax=Didymodactylos carnosus TaxID=1234261 RepID=A0A8S2KLZ9_9BILA|nr:unnamed protein product [Didymodactylos carnosus]CAF3861238.1 unnamed protein product [Didymodactylos carnosus]